MWGKWGDKDKEKNMGKGEGLRNEEKRKREWLKWNWGGKDWKNDLQNSPGLIWNNILQRNEK